MDILTRKYDIREGIIRCGDDLMFDEKRLKDFIKMVDKPRYIGRVWDLRKTYNFIPGNSMPNTFMYDYYKIHTEDFKNKLHGLSNYNLDDIKKMSSVPKCAYCVGIIYFVSIDSVKVLIDHMKSIEYNIFKKDIDTNCYTIEDIGVGYILNKNNIEPTHYHLYAEDNNTFKHYPLCFGIHTNYLK
jgi:hypothetical protein